VEAEQFKIAANCFLQDASSMRTLSAGVSSITQRSRIGRDNQKVLSTESVAVLVFSLRELNGFTAGP
jgi:hypothetical protein